MAAADRVAVGTSGAATGTVVLQEDNASGVSGSVSINYLGGPTTSETLNLTAEFDPTFRATVNVPAFEESGETNDQLANWHLRGLRSGVHTDADGTLYTRVTDTGPGGPYLVELFNDAARGAGDRVLSGTLETATGEVILQGDAANGFGDVFGTVHLDYAGDQDAELTATFATLGDLMNAVKVSNTYSEVRLREDGRGIEFVSQLAGATLTVSERFVSVPVSGDDQQQLSGLSLTGVSHRSNTDIDGNLHAEIVDAGAGTSPRYQVRVYRDAARTELVASGGTDLLGAQAVQLQAENDSALSGSVTLDFSGDDSDLLIPLWQPRVQQDNQGPGGGPQLSQLALEDLDPGRNADPDGNLYAELLDVAGSPTVRLYKDAAHTQLVAEGSIGGPSGLVTLSEQNNSGLTGSVYVDYNADDLAITVTQPRGLRASGQEQQANIFSTFNDSIEAMLGNDTDRLTNLLDNFDVDLGRILDGRAETGSRADRMELLQVRHEDETINFSDIRAERVDLDYADAVVRFQAAQSVFEASLRTTGRLIPLSLVDFI
jgi:flagellin-like hook-associated protein FlgL